MQLWGIIKYVTITLLLLMVIKDIKGCRNKNNKNLTTLQVSNPTSDTVIVYLTLDENGSDWVEDVNGIFGIVSNKKSQGAFILLPKKTVSYKSKKPFSGNISFFDAPINCPFPSPTLYEFCLNNYKTIKDAQETVDISCVYGVTTIGSFTLEGGGIWNSGQNDTIKHIQNDLLYKNTGKAGIFPYGCTTCIGREGMLKCSNQKKYEKVNLKNICTVQRDSKNSGGTVTITYISN